MVRSKPIFRLWLSFPLMLERQAGGLAGQVPDSVSSPGSAPVHLPAPSLDPATASDPTRASNCNLLCPNNIIPVCGTDGKIYDNKCVLLAADCKNKAAGGTGIDIAHQDLCGE